MIQLPWKAQNGGKVTDDLLAISVAPIKDTEQPPDRARGLDRP